MAEKCKSCAAREIRNVTNMETYDACLLYQYPCDMITKCDYIVLKDIAQYSTDVQPVRRGKWLHDRKTQWKCSECGNFLDFDGLNCGRGSAFYCPNCGADMREVSDADAEEIANVIEFKKRMKR